MSSGCKPALRYMARRRHGRGTHLCLRLRSRRCASGRSGQAAPPLDQSRINPGHRRGANTSLRPAEAGCCVFGVFHCYRGGPPIGRILAALRAELGPLIQLFPAVWTESRHAMFRDYRRPGRCRCYYTTTNLSRVSPSCSTSSADRTLGDLGLSFTDPPFGELMIVPFTEVKSSMKNWSPCL